MYMYVPYLLDQTLRLLFILSRNFVQLLFEKGYYLRAAFIKLGGIGKIICKHTVRKGFEFYKINKKLRCTDNFSFLTSCLFVKRYLHSTFNPMPRSRSQTPLPTLKKTKTS